MAQRTITMIVTLGMLSIAVPSIVIADSVDAPTKRNHAPAEHIVSEPAADEALEIDGVELKALAENTEAEEVRGWSEIWE